MKNKSVIFWDGGLTAIETLKIIQSSTPKEDIILVSLLNSNGNEVGLTGIPEEIISLQARFLGIKLVRLYQDELCLKVLSKFQNQGYKFYSGSRSSKLNYECVREIKIHYPLAGKSYQELREQSQARCILTSVNSEEMQRYLGKEISDIDLELDTYNVDTFAIYDPLFRIRIPFSKNIVVQQGDTFICKIRSV